MKHYLPGMFGPLRRALDDKDGLFAESPAGVEPVTAVEKDPATRRTVLTIGGNRVDLNNDTRMYYSFYRETPAASPAAQEDGERWDGQS